MEKGELPTVPELYQVSEFKSRTKQKDWSGIVDVKKPENSKAKSKIVLKEEGDAIEQDDFFGEDDEDSWQHTQNTMSLPLLDSPTYCLADICRLQVLGKSMLRPYFIYLARLNFMLLDIPANHRELGFAMRCFRCTIDTNLREDKTYSSHVCHVSSGWFSSDDHGCTTWQTPYRCTERHKNHLRRSGSCRWVREIQLW